MANKLTNEDMKRIKSILIEIIETAATEETDFARSNRLATRCINLLEKAGFIIIRSEKEDG